MDKIFKKLNLDENIINKTEKLPNKINFSIEKGKLIINQWKQNELNSLINDCLNIENNIKEIISINEYVKKYSSLNLNIKFMPNKKDSKEILEIIKNYGKIQKGIFDSKIDFDEELINYWLNNKSFTAELLFRKSRDGSTPNDFHSKCDNKGITITFIETNKGYKFGGYTETPWDCSNQYKTDKSTFIFSFNYKEKYRAKNYNNFTLACDKNSGPRIGNDDIYIKETLNKGETKNMNFIEDRKITNGEQYWDIKELEVYKLIYI